MILTVTYRPCHGYYGTVTVAGRVVYSVYYTMTHGAAMARLQMFANR